MQGIKKLWIPLLCLLALLLCTPAAFAEETSIVDSGTCGENLTWILDSEGTLSICGKGTLVTSPCDEHRDSIKTLEITGNVTVIGAGSFSNYTNLTRVTIPNSVFAIAGSAFSGCTSLKSVSIPASVSNIGPAAFDGCSSLTSVGLSTGLSSIVNGVFSGCTSLTDVYFTGTQEEWNNINIMVDNEPLTNATLHLATLFGTCGENLTWTLDSEGTFTISGKGAMDDYHDPTEITTPCRDYRTSIKSVVLEEGVTYVGEWAFYVGTNLTSITLPKSLTGIGYNAFHSCSSLTDVTIPENVTSIGGSAFAYCSSLIDVAIPKNMTSLGGMVFGYCDSLTSLNVAEGNPVYHSDGNCIIETETKTLIQGCSASTIPSDGSVTSIGDSAFVGCSGLTSMTIPDGVTSIGKYAFSDCSSLTSVTIPDSVTSIGKFAFSDDSSLTGMTIPKSVTSIGEGAFNRCSGLKSLTVVSGNPVYHSDGNCIIETETKTLIQGCSASTIPSDGSVTSIGDSAFAGCSGLTSMTIPGGVTSIGKAAFYGCTSLTDVYFNGTQEEWNKITIGEGNDCLTNADIHFTASPVASGTCGENLTWTLDSEGTFTISGTGDMPGEGPLFGENRRTLVKTVVISNGVTSIRSAAFQGYSNLSSVTIPDSLISMGKVAFYGCSALTEITIPGSVTSIGQGTFIGCKSLVSVTIQEGVTSIDSSAFTGCSSLSQVMIPESVTSIGATAFTTCSSLRSITIPENVTQIGGEAFAHCSALTNVTISKNLTSIGWGAFGNCTNLTDVYFNGTQEEWNSIDIEEANQCLTSAKIHFIIDSGICGENLTWMLDDEGTLIVSGTGEMANYHEPTGILTPWYDKQDSIKTVVLDKGVTHIGEWAFAECQNLTSIEISDSVTSIGSYAFFVCKHLTDVEIPEGVISIGGFAFSGCDSLRSVVIADSVTSIGCSAFSSTKITSVVLPKNLTSIQSHTFLSCGDLTSVTIPAAVTSIDEYAFFCCTSLTNIYFGGTKTEWERLTVGAHNELLQAAQVHCQRCGRVSGTNRYATALAVADELKKTWEVEKFNAIILASGQDFADALVGSYLANVKSAPILLSWGQSGKYAYLDTDNIDYIQKNLAANGVVYILGGTNAVPDSYDKTLKNNGITVKRLEGNDRFATNLAILAEAGVPAGSEVLVCDGSNFADSLSASATGKPILLLWNQRGSLYGKQAVFLNSLQDCTFTIIGGQDAIGSNFENVLSSYGKVTRIAGENRLETSVKVAEKYFRDPTAAVVSYAWDFPDGLCGGVLAHAMGAPLILTAAGFETQAAEYVAEWGLGSGIALGGTDALPDSSITQIFN